MASFQRSWRSYTVQTSCVSPCPSARVLFLKGKSNHAISLVKSLQWSPFACRINPNYLQSRAFVSWPLPCCQPHLSPVSLLLPMLHSYGLVCRLVDVPTASLFAQSCSVRQKCAFFCFLSPGPDWGTSTLSTIQCKQASLPRSAWAELSFLPFYPHNSLTSFSDHTS